MTIKTANKNCRSLVQDREPFQGSNLYANIARNNLYIVYSYGEHFPLFIYDPQTQTWLENSDRYSATTSHHRSKAHPHCDTVKINTEQMNQVLNTGTIAGIVTPINNAA